MVSCNVVLWTMLMFLMENQGAASRGFHFSGKISCWIDLDSEDEVLRADSEKTLKQEISWASHLSLQV